ncbi:EAL domain-containing protein [Rhodobacterales bacterium HKCCE3408]|nr:EAL domain-containing protein [Rhodobacterales bacterium HKCCE3408]
MPSLGKARLSDAGRFSCASPVRAETLALFPLLAIVVASLWDRSVAEATGIVLPALLMIDVLTRLLRRAPEPPTDGFSRDPTTGLPLRGAAEAALAAVAARDRMTTACLFVRLDGQENLARKWGPDGRDDILRRTAERVRVTLRGDDTMARVEDGTFAIVLHPQPLVRSETVRRIAARLQSSIAEPIHIGGGTANVTASIGIATPDPLEVRDLAQGAETAVAEAQGCGPGSVQDFSSDLHDRVKQAAELTRSVDQAFAEGEIRAWFQPQICTDTGEISGFEALARWHHPALGLLAPGQFLQPIRNAGRMARLGETMMSQALSALAAWDRRGLRVPSVAVNFSPEELRDPGLSDRVKWEVDRHDMRPGRLTVEILESVAALGHDDMILRNVDQLASHGFNLDLDDFGTGQASISNIRRFRAQRIKIDRSFVSGIDADPEQQSMVAAILALAEHLGVETLAEGVETSGEHSILAQLGCGHVQGFGIARPMPFEETVHWIDRHRTHAVSPPRIGRRAG